MARVNIENVTSTILETSYFETLATTELDTEKIDGETVVTDPDDVFIVRSAQITIDELHRLLDFKLVNPRDAAARFRAISLAINPDTTAKQIYEALKDFTSHPAVVSVVVSMGKNAVLEVMTLLRECGNCDIALEKAAGEGRIEAMRLLAEWGAEDYDSALISSAGKGQLEAIDLLDVWGAEDYDRALNAAAKGGHLIAMTRLKELGAWKYGRALDAAAYEGHLEAMRLLIKWGVAEHAWNAWTYDLTLLSAAEGGQLEAMSLLKELGATNFNQALNHTTNTDAINLLRKWTT